MEFYRELTAKDGRTLILRHAEAADAAAYLQYFLTAHKETDFLTTYPEEATADEDTVAVRIAETAKAPDAIELCALIDGRLIGSAGIACVRRREKTAHRASFGISILREYWGIGIGSALTEACISLAQEAGYLQIELEVVSENERAVHLYRRFGFTEYGRNPKAFRTRDGRWQELIYMRKELGDADTVLAGS